MKATQLSGCNSEPFGNYVYLSYHDTYDDDDDDDDEGATNIDMCVQKSADERSFFSVYSCVPDS